MFQKPGIFVTCKVFVDGREGTTGLKIHGYLAQRPDLEVSRIDPEKRKDTAERRKLINGADIVFLCLPDDAAIESASLVEGNTRVIDASTAHRTHPDWTYGLPELDGNQRDFIRRAQRVSNPGCHATAFTLALHPLVREGIVPADYPVTCCSVTGYSGAGRKMIETYEQPGAAEVLRGPRHYALKLTHKHVPEMQKMTGLSFAPLFSPIIANVAQGLAVSIPLFPRLFRRKASARDIRELLASYYAGEPFIRVVPHDADAFPAGGYLDITACNGTNRADIFVFGREDQILLLTRLDNLGKGASGAAIQNMNIMLGLPEDTGLKA
ncbi:MAG: N-acetyl-gamma-glutamyl-phosphate reductase [Peptococcaceae bacterium]|nr:N-acetyl-gamma-glutamyl-phosphate reductase [Peptococcaceae bacterium]